MPMMQGDSFNVSVFLKNNSGQPITPADVEDVEITIGKMIKSYKKAQLSYQDGRWLFPLSQEESFGQWPMRSKAQVRVKWANGFVEGQALQGVRFDESISKEVL